MIEIGPHAVTCSSVESPAVDAMMSRCEKAHILYSDPPWGDGNLKYWATLNRRHTGREFVPLTYSALQERIVDLVRKYVDGYVFIETGKKWKAELAARLGSVLANVQSEEMHYKGGGKILDCVVVYGTTSNSHQIPADFSMKDGIGLDIVKYAVSKVSKEGGIVFDPCCGMGYSAKAAVASGMVFRGNEFNGKRLQKTVDFLKREVA